MLAESEVATEVAAEVAAVDAAAVPPEVAVGSPTAPVLVIVGRSVCALAVEVIRIATSKAAACSGRLEDCIWDVVCVMIFRNAVVLLAVKFRW